MLENLTVTDIVVHEIYQRQDRKPIPPTYATAVERLSQEAMDAFQQRVTDALSAKAKAVDMQIIRTGPGTFQRLARVLAAEPDSARFLLRSREVADKLIEAQTSQQFPGGIVIVFRGTTGLNDWPFIGVIKAEVQDGFRRKLDGGTLTTEFVRDLFMTRATRLYKIGFFVSSAPDVEHDDRWLSLVYDHGIVAANREAAALYFYEAFLGCGFKEDAAYETKKFFDLTRQFVNKQVTEREERHEINDSLYTYVKNDQSPTFTVEEFAERHLPEAIRDPYRSFMRGRQFPDRAVRRDTGELRGKLRRRRFKYGTDIEISASPEAINEGRVTFEVVKVDADGVEGRPSEVTVITVKDRFIREE